MAVSYLTPPLLVNMWFIFSFSPSFFLFYFCINSCDVFNILMPVFLCPFVLIFTGSISKNLIVDTNFEEGFVTYL